MANLSSILTEAPPWRRLFASGLGTSQAHGLRMLHENASSRTPPADSTERSRILALSPNVKARVRKSFADRFFTLLSTAGPAYGLALRTLIADLVVGSYA